MEESGFCVIQQYINETKAIENNLDTFMNIDQQVPAAAGQGGFLSTSWGELVPPSQTLYPRAYPPSPSPSPPAASSLPTFLTSPCGPSPPPAPQWELQELVKELAGPSPGCTLTPVCDQQLMPEESPDFIDMDAVHLYPPGSSCPLGKAAPPPPKAEPLGPGLEGEGEEQVPEELRRQLIRDLALEISHDCAILNIDRNPELWSEENVKHWIHWTAARSMLTNVCMANFAVSGACLCAMSEEEFVQRDPINGGSLHTSLSLWKFAQLNRDRVSEAALLPSCPSPDSSSSSRDSTSPHSDCSSPPSPPPGPLVTSSSDEDLRLPEGSEHRQTIHLWQFLKELLNHGSYRRYIRWLDRPQGIFKIEDSVKVAKLWGMRKNRPAMNYDKLSRSVRQYYKKGIIKKTAHSKRLVYQFCAPYL